MGDLFIYWLSQRILGLHDEPFPEIDVDVKRHRMEHFLFEKYWQDSTKIYQTRDEYTWELYISFKKLILKNQTTQKFLDGIIDVIQLRIKQSYLLQKMPDIYESGVGEIPQLNNPFLLFFLVMSLDEIPVSFLSDRIVLNEPLDADLQIVELRQHNFKGGVDGDDKIPFPFSKEFIFDPNKIIEINTKDKTIEEKEAIYREIGYELYKYQEVERKEADTAMDAFIKWVGKDKDSIIKTLNEIDLEIPNRYAKICQCTDHITIWNSTENKKYIMISMIGEVIARLLEIDFKTISVTDIFIDRLEKIFVVHDNTVSTHLYEKFLKYKYYPNNDDLVYEAINISIVKTRIAPPRKRLVRIMAKYHWLSVVNNTTAPICLFFHEYVLEPISNIIKTIKRLKEYGKQTEAYNKIDSSSFEAFCKSKVEEVVLAEAEAKTVEANSAGTDSEVKSEEKTVAKAEVKADSEAVVKSETETEEKTEADKVAKSVEEAKSVGKSETEADTVAKSVEKAGTVLSAGENHLTQIDAIHIFPNRLIIHMPSIYSQKMINVFIPLIYPKILNIPIVKDQAIIHLQEPFKLLSVNYYQNILIINLQNSPKKPDFKQKKNTMRMELQKYISEYPKSNWIDAHTREEWNFYNLELQKYISEAEILNLMDHIPSMHPAHIWQAYINHLTID